jgi:hypothetical protein
VLETSFALEHGSGLQELLNSLMFRNVVLSCSFDEIGALKKCSTDPLPVVGLEELALARDPLSLSFDTMMHKSLCENISSAINSGKVKTGSREDFQPCRSNAGASGQAPKITPDGPIVSLDYIIIPERNLNSMITGGVLIFTEGIKDTDNKPAKPQAGQNPEANLTPADSVSPTPAADSATGV